jgi:dipeptidyl aminopeptidase/acylaminoacyl peptidase
LALRPDVIAYGEHPSQFCEAFAPRDAEPHPVAVLVHGGFWRQRYGCGLQWGIARDLVDRGWAVWNIEYRRLGGGGGWPLTFEDAAAAIDALADAGDRFDLGRVVGIGHSAGGQIAVWAAARDDARVRLTGAVSQAGALDLHELSRLRTSDAVVHQLLEGTPDEVPQRYELASPRRRLPIGVPMLLVHGVRDDDVPVHVSREFATAATARGDDCRLVIVDDEGHYEHLEPGSRCWEAVVEWLAS